MTKIDKLDRQDFIKFVENLIVNSDSYKRDSDSKSYVMALDSAWGTGKSFFIDLLIQDIEEQDNIFVVKYNAWANDYCDNAFNPLIYDILDADCLKFSTETEADIQNAKKLLKSAFDVGKVFTKGLINEAIKNKTGVDVEKALDEVIKSTKDFKSFMFREIPNLNELNEQRDAFNELKTYLSNATEWMQEDAKKLVVIIDELDRCKPTFAIQTLEIVKHIFDVNNIVFLFAVDIEQLSHSVSTIYGQEFDSVGYLCRFFDYIAKLPNPKIEKFISHKLEEVGFDRQNPEIIRAHEYICELVRFFNLSLRDIDTVMQSYKILNDTKLKEYKILDAHFVYLFYLILKYKMPDIYFKIFVDKSQTTESIALIRNSSPFDLYETSENVILIESFDNLEDDNKLYARKMNLYSEGATIYKELEIESINHEKIKIKGDYRVIEIDDYTNWGNVLFYPDLLKWEEIFMYTYREYIHKQLENYNFMNIETKEEE